MPVHAIWPGETAEALPGKPRWWQWPTILSLDAPIVALLWQWLVARSANLTLQMPHVFVLGASVWLAYVADRWIEGWRLTRACTQRHIFYQRWRWPVATVWLAVLVGDVATALVGFSAHELKTGFMLLAAVLMYLISHQLIHRHRAWRAPKEICVAALLGGGVALFPLLQSAIAWRLLIAPLGFFVLLCFINCALISAWEREVDETHGQTSIALQFRRGAAFSAALPWMLMTLAIGFSLLEANGPALPAALCAVASSLALGVINFFEPLWGRRLARVLADVALMTPIVPLLFSWLR